MKKEKHREEKAVKKETAQKNSSRQTTEKGKIFKHIFWIALISLLVLGFYRLSLALPFFGFVMMGYMLALMGLILVYIIYNRGFTRLNLKENELPDSLTAEEKRAYIESGEKRLHRSRWVLYFIIALVLTFLADALELFVISSIVSWF